MGDASGMASLCGFRALNRRDGSRFRSSPAAREGAAGGMIRPSLPTGGHIALDDTPAAQPDLLGCGAIVSLVWGSRNRSVVFHRHRGSSEAFRAVQLGWLRRLGLGQVVLGMICGSFSGRLPPGLPKLQGLPSRVRGACGSACGRERETWRRGP